MAYSNISDLRAARDAALKDSDFWLLTDSPIKKDLREVSEAVIKIYRQQLRDITVGVTTSNVGSVELPTLVLPY